ncbi:uncharacterized protein LOC108911459 [Anoplophora glabripennis]|nr:uncharacterized protein LOC108911459 [Anoplophora glabripennis]
MIRCKICLATFSKQSNLRRHAKKFHSDELEEVAPVKKYSSVEICTQCGKSFSKYSNLVQHIKKFHYDKKNDLIVPKVYNYKCDHDGCNKQFTYLRHFQSHKKIHAEIDSNSKKFKLKCPLCDYENSSKLQLISHYHCVHDIICNSYTKEFNNLDEFHEWKSLFEMETNSCFVSQHGTYVSDTYTKTVYVCHRTGYYKKKGNNLRHLKGQGSNKINGYCPAEMSLKFFKSNNTCEVKYLITHVGHVNDLEHLSLTKLERQQLAEKIAARVPFSYILNDTRDSICNDLKRIHLLTKKDLYNIQQIYNLNKDTAKHENDAASINLWRIGDSVSLDAPGVESHNLTINEEEGLKTNDEVKIVEVFSQINSENYINIEGHFKVEKEKVMKQFMKIMSKVTSSEDLQIVKRAITPISAILTVDGRTSASLVGKYKVANNKKIHKQRCISSTKKKACSSKIQAFQT